MVEPVSVLLKFGFLAVLYLFLLWITRSVLLDLRRGRTDYGGGGGGYGGGAGYEEQPPPPPDATAMHQAASGLGAGGLGDEPRLVVERAPGHQAGSSYDLAGGATLGRGDVEIQLEDPFASSRHARILRQGSVFVLEDLGSTNGTYLNEQPLKGPAPLHLGDRIRIGDSEFVVRS